MSTKPFLFINGRKVFFDNERNLLKVIRKAHIDLPTFCYHSELSVYGACRLCIVDIEGRGIVSSCSTKPEQGLKVLTGTEELRQIRRISLELLLANHDQNCTSCIKSSSCRLQSVARRLGVDEVRFKTVESHKPKDESTYGISRDPNKCILCGDCVRACNEIQGIGAIDFAFRGHEMSIVPSFGRELGDVSCVECGQYARVCPTGALTPKSDIDRLWQVINDKKKYVVAQIAPAVRVALGEMFGMAPGTDVTGQMVAALKYLGFKKVYDTSFSADLTIIEETNEFLQRKAKGENLPLITSCCPAWVKFAEFYFPEFLPNVSTCRSPQQMLGSLVKKILPKDLGMHREDIVMVSVMPCTAKRGESNRPEFALHGTPDVDIVITTQELGAMIQQMGLRFASLEPEAFDMPFGFKTGGGVIFGNSGGVSEAVLRYAAEKLSGKQIDVEDVHEVRGENGIRNVTLNLGGQELKLSVVQGLRNARHLLNEVKKGKVQVDFIEVMSCPGGCVGGSGQPVSAEVAVRRERTKSLYRADKTMQLHASQDNPYIAQLYQNILGEPGMNEAHHLLHTEYRDRSDIFEGEVVLSDTASHDLVELKVCVGANCLAQGSDELLGKLVDYVAEEGLTGEVVIVAHHNVEPCDHGMTVHIDDDLVDDATFDSVRTVLMERIQYARKNA